MDTLFESISVYILKILLQNTWQTMGKIYIKLHCCEKSGKDYWIANFLCHILLMSYIFRKTFQFYVADWSTLREEDG